MEDINNLLNTGEVSPSSGLGGRLWLHLQFNG